MSNFETTQHALVLLRLGRISNELRNIKQTLDQITKQRDTILNRIQTLQREKSQLDLALKVKKVFTFKKVIEDK